MRLGLSLSGGSSERTFPECVSSAKAWIRVLGSAAVPSAAVGVNAPLGGMEGRGNGEWVDVWRQSTNGCGAAVLGIIIADWVIGAVSEVFFYYKAAEKLWWSVAGGTPPPGGIKLLVSLLGEKEQLIFKFMFKILGCVRGVCC